jgi:hypothetical protein
MAVNNFNIGRHLRDIHNVGTEGSETPPIDVPTYESSSSSDADSGESESAEDNDKIDCTNSANDSRGNESSSSSADTGDDETNEGNDSDCINSGDDEDDEAEKTVEDYIREMTDDALKTHIKYDAKRVLKYLSWTRRPLTPLEHEAIKFLRCASFGHGLSKAHANEWLAYERDFGGRAALLPKSIDTVWSTMANAHRDMSGEIMRKTVVLPIPIEVPTPFLSPSPPTLTVPLSFFPFPSFFSSPVTVTFTDTFGTFTFTLTLTFTLTSPSPSPSLVHS